MIAGKVGKGEEKWLKWDSEAKSHVGRIQESLVKLVKGESLHYLNMLSF